MIPPLRKPRRRYTSLRRYAAGLDHCCSLCHSSAFTWETFGDTEGETATALTIRQAVGQQTVITRLRQRSLEHVGMGVSLEGPATDLAILARSFSRYGEASIVEPAAIRPALVRGLWVVKEERRLALIETVIQPG